jgi:hypothetical protein
MTAPDLLGLGAVLAAWLTRELTPMVLAWVKSERKARRDADAASRLHQAVTAANATALEKLANGDRS